MPVQAASSKRSSKAMFKELKEIGPGYGYFPEPRKSIIVVTPENLQLAQQSFADEGFKVVTGSRYLGGFIGSKADLEVWLEGKITMWMEALGGEFSNIANIFPQTAYAGVVKPFQLEWQFVATASNRRHRRTIRPDSRGPNQVPCRIIRYRD